MEDVAGIDLAPLHVRCGAVEGENPDSAGFVVNPVVELVALHRFLQVEADWEIEQQDRCLGDVNVMHHRAVPDWHIDLLRDGGAVGIDDEVADEIPGPVVGRHEAHR